jgi:hypothetical protein
MDEGEFRRRLDAVEEQWNASEQFIKRVERLRRGEVVVASINELRYAGRTLIEGYAHFKGCAEHPEREADANLCMREAAKFCLRAKHDAVDSAIMYIDQALLFFEEEFGLPILHEHFPDYIDMKRSLQEIGEIMSASRGDRDKRDSLYANINDTKLDQLIDHHNRLETSTAVFEAIYREKIKGEKRDGFRFYAGWIVAILALLVALVGSVGAVLALPPFQHLFDPKPPPAASSPSTPAKPGVQAPPT